MGSLADFLDQFAIESGEVGRLAAGHDAVVRDDLFVHPICARVNEVGFNGWIGSHAAAFDCSGFDESAWAVADGANGFSGVNELANEFNGLRLDAQLVGIHDAAGQQERVVISRIGLGEGNVYFEFAAPIHVFAFPPFDLFFGGRDDLRYCAGGFESFFGTGEFHLFKSIGDKNRHSFSI